MQYKSTFPLGYLQIDVSADDNRALKAIRDFLSIPEGRPRLGHKIQVKFIIKKAERSAFQGETGFVFQKRMDEKGELVSSFGERIAFVRASPLTGTVRADVLPRGLLETRYFLNSVFLQPLHFILAHHGLFFVHASCVARDDQCILICGEQHSGKSTLAMALARSGFDLVSDDDCFVRRAGKDARIHPFPTKMGVKEALLKRYPELRRCIVKDFHFGEKSRVSLQDAAGCSVLRDQYQCRIILFPEYKSGGGARLKKLSTDEAAARLIRENRNFYALRSPRKKAQADLFWSFHQLAHMASSYRLIYHDRVIGRVPDLVRDVFCPAE